VTLSGGAESLEELEGVALERGALESDERGLFADLMSSDPGTHWSL
jgi:hypothetical protein